MKRKTYELLMQDYRQTIVVAERAKVTLRALENEIARACILPEVIAAFDGCSAHLLGRYIMSITRHNGPVSDNIISRIAYPESDDDLDDLECNWGLDGTN